MSRFDLGDYVDVNARLAWFFEHYPEGSLGSRVIVGPEQGLAFVVVQASAFRTPTDARPGQGLAYEVFPGTTPYTKGSELMNAETSAWGRALAAVGAPTKGHVASRDEVEGARQREHKPTSEPAAESPPPAEPDGEVPKLPLPDHEHDWGQSPTMKSFAVCKDPTCRKVVKKSELPEGVEVA